MLLQQNCFGMNAVRISESIIYKFRKQQIILTLRKMFIHHQYKSPLNKNTHSISYESSRLSTHEQMTERIHQRQQINELFHNFISLSNTVDIDLTKNHFNLIEYGKEDQKIKYDPQIMNAKLKRLQNQAQINRIDFELQQRNKKTKSKYHRSLSNQNPFQNSTYQQNYQSFLKNHQLIDLPLNDSQSEEDQKNFLPHPKGISTFNQLKKHSKILQYTMKKIQQREQRTIKQQKQTDQRKQKVKNMTNQLRDYGEFTDVILTKKTLHSTSKNTEINPEAIVEDKFKRIMTMKANDKISEKVKVNPRCGRMMNLQNEILIELEEEKKSLSKDNMKKLKSRFIQIVNQLNKGDRKRKENKLLLPLIDSMASSVQNSTRTAPTSRTTSLISKTIDVKNRFGQHTQRDPKFKKR